MIESCMIFNSLNWQQIHAQLQVPTMYAWVNAPDTRSGLTGFEHHSCWQGLDARRSGNSSLQYAYLLRVVHFAIARQVGAPWSNHHGIYNRRIWAVRPLQSGVMLGLTDKSSNFLGETERSPTVRVSQACDCWVRIDSLV